MKTVVIYNSATGFIRSISAFAESVGEGADALNAAAIAAQAAGWGAGFEALDVTELNLTPADIAANVVSITLPGGYAVDTVNKVLVGAPA